MTGVPPRGYYKPGELQPFLAANAALSLYAADGGEINTLPRQLLSLSGYPNTSDKVFQYFRLCRPVRLPGSAQPNVGAVNSEQADRIFHDYLLSVAPVCQREIIASIRDDAIKHFAMLRRICWEVTRQDMPPGPGEEIAPPANYCAGIRDALFGEPGR